MQGRTFDSARMSGRKHRERIADKNSWRHDLLKNKTLYILAIPLIAYFLIFNYAPMFGLVMAFQDFKPARGFLGSEWVGFQNFIDFFTSPNFFTTVRNTFVISALGLFVGFPLSVVFALLINEIRIIWFKKGVQTISYMPYFVSTIVLCGLVIEFCSSKGLITNVLVDFGILERQNLLQNPNYFWMINLISDLWQCLGYSSIVFIAAITNVSGELHEAAAIDGANRLQRVWHITLPGIKPMVVVMLILKCGMLMSVGFDKILNKLQRNILWAGKEDQLTVCVDVPVSAECELMMPSGAVYRLTSGSHSATEKISGDVK